MPEITDHDLVVVGAGPGGYIAAFHAADRGMKVTMINDLDKPGGTCLHVGCIPSKALLHTAKLITDARDGARFGVKFGEPQIDVDAVRKHWRKIVDGMSTALAGTTKRRKIQYINGRAKLVDGQTLELADGSRHRFAHCILATGSTPAKPKALAVDSPRIMTSTEALRLEGVPGSLLIVGGGYIGLELGYVYAALGCPVTVVEMTDGLLPGVDRDLVEPLAKRLKSLFTAIHLKTQVTSLEDTPSGVRVQLKGEGLTDTSPVFDRVLVAVGRRPSSQGLGLENTRIETDERGFIKIDQQCRTAEPKIFAIGDVAGEPMLAHKASYEARVAVEAIAGEPAAIDYRAMPAVVFTDPEIAWCGLTENEAKKQGRTDDIAVLSFPWAASGRAMTMGRTEGISKLLVDKKTEQILGVGIVGADAGEMIAEGVLAVEMGSTARDMTLTIHAHPTLSETLFEAAEFMHGPGTHVYKPKRGAEKA